MKHYIGDAVMSEPMIEAIERRFADVEILTGGVVDQVLWTPDRSRVFIKTKRVHSPWQVIRQAKELRSRRYDVAVLVNHSFRSALTVRLAGIRKRVGHVTEGRGSLLTQRVENDPDLFEATNLLRLAHAVGAEAPVRTPRLPTTAEEQESGKAIAKGAVVGIQPGARWPAKQIPVEVTIEVAKQLKAEGYSIALLGGREEASVSDQVRQALNGEVVWLVGETSVRQTLGVLRSLRAMLGGDTGLMHLSAGVGTPLVSVFGPTPYKKWGHDYSPNRVLRAPEGRISAMSAEAVSAALQEVLR
jgi:heptosyltransferase-2